MYRALWKYVGENVTSHLEYPPAYFHLFCDDSKFLDEDTFELEPMEWLDIRGWTKQVLYRKNKRHYKYFK